MSEVVYQAEIAKLHHESWLFPKTLRGRSGVHRLQIAGDLETLGESLAALNLPEAQWIVFASEDALEDSQGLLRTIGLDQEQAQRFERLSMFHQVVYGTYRNLSQAVELMSSSLWDLGAGIALPLREMGHESINEALGVQLELDERLVQAVDGPYGVFAIACTDAWGVDVVWRQTSSYAPHLDAVAKQLAVS